MTHDLAFSMNDICLRIVAKSAVYCRVINDIMIDNVVGTSRVLCQSMTRELCLVDASLAYSLSVSR